jgi:two-component system LytT family response regulator
MSNMSRFNALIVDDELNACKNLDNILSEFLKDEIKVCGYAHSIDDAEMAIRSLKPDIIFLDIEIQDGNSLALLEKFKPITFEVIFVTAYEEYALRALKLNVIDYLLKPIDITELKIAVRKVIDKSLNPSFPGSMQSNTSQFDKQQIVLKDHHNNYSIVKLKHIVYVEALKGYSKIFFKHDGQTKVLTMSKSISEYEDLLPQALFLRIHRSFLVNYEYVKMVLSEQQILVLTVDNLQLPISRRRYSEVFSFLKGKRG